MLSQDIEEAASRILETSEPIDLGPKNLEEEEDFDDSSGLLELGAKFLYDSETFGVDKDLTKGLFKGDVVLIGNGSIITADVVEYNNEKQQLTAKGHVLLLSANQVFTGSSIILYWEKGEFEIQDAVMVANDPETAQKVVSDILGMTAGELAFESAKSARLTQIEGRKTELRQNLIENGVTTETLSEDQVETYTRFLEQQSITEKAKNPRLAEIDEPKRRRFLKRRKYWLNSRNDQGITALRQTYYLKLSGTKISKTNKYDYTAYDATWTSCKCDEGEIPPLSFRSNKIVAREEGYLDFSHPVLLVKGVPVLYIPFLRVPFKTERQSGFLMPGIQTGDKKNGFVYSQPIYFDFADNYDATLNVDVFQKRGTRFALENRYEARANSGFRFKVESIRDRTWVQESNNLVIIRDYHLDQDRYCRSKFPDATDEEIEACNQSVVDHLLAPNNSWRGKRDWNGRFFLTPRLSFVTNGTSLSDHRYIEDLYLPEDLSTAFSTRAQANAYSPAKAKFSYNESNYYLGLKSSLGDRADADKPFTGLQILGHLSFMSRYYNINPNLWFDIPIYMAFQGNRYEFQDNKGFAESDSVESKNIGAGQWQQAKSKLIAPVLREGVARVDLFSEIEGRYIDHKGLETSRSSINSWRTGFTLNLPIDGLGELPSWLSSEESDNDKTTYIEHVMNWWITVSTRPSVARRGDYSNPNESNVQQVYFATDRATLISDDRDVDPNEAMIPHQRITFGSSHSWSFFDRSWGVIPRSIYGGEPSESSRESIKERARRELLESLERPLEGDTSFFDTASNDSTNWYFNRFVREDTNKISPLSLTMHMTYDNEQEKLRRKVIDNNKQLEQAASAAGNQEEADTIREGVVGYPNLPRSWTGPYFNLGMNWNRFNLTTYIDYDMYLRTSSVVRFNLTLPSFYQSALALGYTLSKTPQEVSEDIFLFRKTKVSQLNFSTGLIPYISTGISLQQREVEGVDPQYATSLNLAYVDKSGCWGLRFIREKDIAVPDERDARYVLQLSIIFFGNSRGADLSPALERELPRLTFTN